METSHEFASAEIAPSRTRVVVEPVVDTPEMAERNQMALEISRGRAAKIAKITVDILKQGRYDFGPAYRFDLRRQIDKAKRAKISIPPDAVLPKSHATRKAFEELHIRVSNETTLVAAEHLVWAKGTRVLALNFANATMPGGGFLTGARAQEENLCRASGLYATLVGDPMYKHHEDMPDHGLRATDWAILSPEVPVFRTDDGTLLPTPWSCAFLTMAAPQAVRLPPDADTSGIMRVRIQRALAIAHAYAYDSLILGAWGCGAFGCDPVAVSGHFRDALLSPEFLGNFAYATFAIADWSSERRFLRPFQKAFRAKG